MLTRISRKKILGQFKEIFIMKKEYACEALTVAKNARLAFQNEVQEPLHYRLTHLWHHRSTSLYLCHMGIKPLLISLVCVFRNFAIRTYNF